MLVQGMKLQHIYLFTVDSLLSGAAFAQNSAPTSGTIACEAMRRPDLSAMRVNGREVRPGGTLPNGHTLDIPETIEGLENVRFAGHRAIRQPIDRHNTIRYFAAMRATRHRIWNPLQSPFGTFVTPSG